MSNFIKKLTDDLGKGKNLLILLLIFLLAFLEPINRLIKVFKDLPLIVSISGVYLALFTILLYIRNTKKEAAEGVVAEKRYTNNERKWAGGLLLLFTVGFVVFLSFWTVNFINEKRDKKKIDDITKEEEERQRKLREERNKLVNVFTAYFDKNTNEDHFSSQLMFQLKTKIDSANLTNEVYTNRDSKYYEEGSSVRDSIKATINKIGFTKGIITYGDYFEEEKSLVCNIYVHGLNDCIATDTAMELNNGKCLFNLNKNYEINFGTKIQSAADMIFGILLQHMEKYAESQKVLTSVWSEAGAGLPPQTLSLCYNIAGNNAMGEQKYAEAISYYTLSQAGQPANDTIRMSRVTAYTLNKELDAAKTLLDSIKTPSAQKNILINYIHRKERDPNFRRNGYIKQGDTYGLMVNGRMIADNFNVVDEVYVNNKRYYLAGSDTTLRMYDEKGVIVENRVQGVPVKTIIHDKVVTMQDDPNKVVSKRNFQGRIYTRPTQ